MKVRRLLFALVLLTGAESAAGRPDVVPLGPYGGDVRRLAVDPHNPSHVLLGTADGQLFSSSDFGRQWSKVRPGLQRRHLVLDSLIFDPVEAGVIYAGGWELKNSKGALFRTFDGGASWEELPLGPYSGTVRAVAVSPSDNRILAVGVTQGVLLSRDRGRTWERITRGYRSLYNVHSLAFDPTAPETLYVGTWQLAWKTPDLGASWEPIHRGMFWDSDLFDLLIDPRDPEVVFAAACSGIYKSSNGGGLWTKLRRGLPAEAKRTRTLHFDPRNPDRLYAGTTAGLFRSDDAGGSWTRLLNDVTVNTIVVHPTASEQLLIGTDDAGVFFSSDAGTTFSPSNRGFHQRQVGSLAQGSEGRLYATIIGDGRHGGFLFSEDRGLSWTGFNDGRPDINATVVTVLPSRQRPDVYLATFSGVLAGRPGDSSWALLGSTDKLHINAMAFADASETTLLLACREGLFLADAASGRVRKQQIAVYDREFLAATRDPDSGTLLAGTEMGVFRSDDEGATWTISVEGLPYLAVSRLFAVGGRLFAGSKSALYYSSDQGVSWRQTDGIFPVEIVAIAKQRTSGRFYASDATVGYLFSSDDGGVTWKGADISQEASRISALLGLGDGEMLAGTLSEGIVRLVFSPNSAAQ